MRLIYDEPDVEVILDLSKLFRKFYPRVAMIGKGVQPTSSSEFDVAELDMN